MLTIVAMFVRNLVILALFAPTAVATAAAPIGIMIFVALIFVRYARMGGAPATLEIKLDSPVSLKRVMSFAFLFLLIQVV